MREEMMEHILINRYARTLYSEELWVRDRGGALPGIFIWLLQRAHGEDEPKLEC